MNLAVLFLFDYSGLAAQPWAEAGYTCFCVDWQHTGETWVRHGAGWIVHVGADVTTYNPPEGYLYIFCASFPECTHTATSGSKHFQAKGIEKLIEALQMWLATRRIVEKIGCPYLIENPRSTISTYYKYTYSIDPCDYGGYLPEGDEHPLYPDHIPPPRCLQERDMAMDREWLCYARARTRRSGNNRIRQRRERIAAIRQTWRQIPEHKKHTVRKPARFLPSRVSSE